MSVTREPKRGDIIRADRIVQGKPYSHFGIYEGGGNVIHYAPRDGSELFGENITIHRVKLDKFKDGCPLEVVTVPGGKSADETMRRVYSRMGEKNYDPATNNCEHFTTWCKTGKHRSFQVDRAKKVIKIVAIPLGGLAGVALAEIICEVHEIAEDYKAPELNSMDRISRLKLIMKNHILNSRLVTTIRNIYSNIKKTIDNPIISDPGPLAKSWYENLGEKIKGWTYPIAGGLEIAKRRGWLPKQMQHIDYNTLGAKVRNGIDKIVVAIDVFIGKKTVTEGLNEIIKNDTALLGKTIGEKQSIPIIEKVKQVFGKVGTIIDVIKQTTILTTVPKSAGNAIKNGFQKLTGGIVNGLKVAGGTIASGVRAVVSSIFGGRK